MASTPHREQRTPVYQRIAGELREGITSGAYGPGSRLPSETELMDQWRVSRLTARKAVRVLVSEGLAEAEPGKGVYVVGAAA
jgi:GntR family transcriptional regulator